MRRQAKNAPRTALTLIRPRPSGTRPGDEDEDRRERGGPEQHEPEERRRHAPCALAMALLQQLAEDGDERGRERRVRQECPDEVRQLERDRERVDLAGGAEVVRG